MLTAAAVSRNHLQVAVPLGVAGVGLVASAVKDLRLAYTLARQRCLQEERDVALVEQAGRAGYQAVGHGMGEQAARGGRQGAGATVAATGARPREEALYAGEEGHAVHPLENV